mmetsp:Transcript_18120/g.46389  ORF Transcript_18120/g.46389 Transcript_18120/m.46389 type:complete len:203 (+) Transcript_18120:214-822(+)
MLLIHGPEFVVAHLLKHLDVQRLLFTGAFAALDNAVLPDKVRRRLRSRGLQPLLGASQSSGLQEPHSQRIQAQCTDRQSKYDGQQWRDIVIPQHCHQCATQKQKAISSSHQSGHKSRILGDQIPPSDCQLDGEWAVLDGQDGSEHHQIRHSNQVWQIQIHQQLDKPKQTTQHHSTCSGKEQRIQLPADTAERVGLRSRSIVQ